MSERIEWRRDDGAKLVIVARKTGKGRNERNAALDVSLHLSDGSVACALFSAEDTTCFDPEGRAQDIDGNPKEPKEPEEPE